MLSSLLSGTLCNIFHCQIVSHTCEKCSHGNMEKEMGLQNRQETKIPWNLRKYVRYCQTTN